MVQRSVRSGIRWCVVKRESDNGGSLPMRCRGQNIKFARSWQFSRHAFQESQRKSKSLSTAAGLILLNATRENRARKRNNVRQGGRTDCNWDNMAEQPTRKEKTKCDMSSDGPYNYKITLSRVAQFILIQLETDIAKSIHLGITY